MTIIRPALPGDYKPLADIYQQVHELHAQNFPNVYQPGKAALLRQDFRERITSSDYKILVAEKDKKVVGFSQLFFRHASPMLNNTFIEEIGVDRNYRRQGIGSALLQEVENISKRHRISSLFLCVYAFNTAAQELYRKAGFEVDLLGDKHHIVMDKFIGNKNAEALNV